MRSSTPLRALLGIGMLAAAMVVVPGVSAPTASAATCATVGGLCAGGEYHPLAPTRIFDTGNGAPVNAIEPVNDVAPAGPKPIGNNAPALPPSFDIDLLGLGGIPATSGDVLAVVVNITVAQPGMAGNLGAYPTGSPPPTLNDRTSLLNFRTFQTTSNLAIVRPGAGGKLTLDLGGAGAVGSASVRVAVDVFGWISTSAYGASVDVGDYRGARLVPLDAPIRILDTRNDAAPDTPLLAGADVPLTIAGAASTTNPSVTVPATDVVGVVANITAVQPTASTFITAQPDAFVPGVDPSTSNLNPAAGQVKANLVIVPVGADGKIHLFNYRGSANVVVDVIGVLQGNVDEATRRGRIVPLTTPFRSFDTRQAAYGNVPLGPGQAETWSYAAFSGSVTIGGTSVGNQLGLLGNLTVASMMRQYPTVPATSFLTTYPGGTSWPGVSNLNFGEAEAIPNMVVARYGSAQTLQVFNSKGYTHYLLDVSAVILDD